MSFLAKALQQAAGSVSISVPGASAKPELLGSIRIAVVGEPSVGKTALTELIASGVPPAGATRSTAGCHIHVKLVSSSDDGAAAGPGSAAGAASSAPGGRFFVELWDVSGQPQYAQLRSVFYKQLNGVILVYDLTHRGSLGRLQKWASEVAHDGSFVAPLPDELAARNLGGLPVPVLVVGNKADRLAAAARHGYGGGGGGSALHDAAAALTGFINTACGSAIGGSSCARWWQRGPLRRRGAAGGSAGALPRPASEAGGLPGLSGGGGGGEAGAVVSPSAQQPLAGLTTSAATGQVDWELLHAFFRSLFERRYAPATGASDANLFIHQRVPSFSGHPGLGGAGPPDAALAGGAAARVALAGGGAAKAGGDRLDDDWV